MVHLRYAFLYYNYNFYAAGLSHEQILKELPDLEKEDIEATIKYARGKIDHPIVAAHPAFIQITCQ